MTGSYSIKHTSFISSIKVEELVSKSSSTPILVKIWSATRNEAYAAGTYEPWPTRQESYSQEHTKGAWRKTGLLLTYLSHDLTQCHLFEVGGFPTHIRPGDDDKVAAFVDVAIVCHRHLSSYSLQDGVTAVLDSQSICEIWTHWQGEQKRKFQHLNLVTFCWFFFKFMTLMQCLQFM